MVDFTALAIVMGFVVQLAFISYSYGTINQKVADIDKRLERVEKTLNGCLLTPKD